MKNFLSSRKGKAFLGLSVNYLSTIVTIVVNLAVIPVYFIYVSKETYGIWLAIGGVTALISIMDFGGLMFLTKMLADNNIFNNREETNRYFSTAFFVQIILAILIVLAGIAVYPFVGNILSIPGTYYLQAKQTFLLVIIAYAIWFPLSSYNAVLNSRQHLALVNILSLIQMMTVNLLPIVFLSQGFRLTSFALAYFFGTIIIAILSYILLHFRYPWVKFTFKFVSYDKIKGIFHYVKSFQILKVAQIAKTSFVNVIISNLLGPATVTVYNLTNKIPMMISANISKVAIAVFPALSQIFADKNEGKAKLRSVYISYSKVILRLSLFCGIGVYFLNEAFISLWVGHDKFSGQGIFILLVLYMIKEIVIASIGTFIYSSGEFRKLPMIALIEVFATLSFSYIGYLYKGFFGLILGVLIASMMTATYSYYLVHQIIGIRIIELIKQSFRYAIFPNIITYFVGYELILLYPIKYWYQLLLFTLFLLIIQLLSQEGVKFIFSKENTLVARLKCAIRV